MASCYLLSMKRSLGIDDHYEQVYALIDDKGQDWCLYEEDIQRISAKVLDALIKNPSLIARCRKKYLNGVKQVLAKLDYRTIRIKLDKMAPKQIIDLFFRSAHRYSQASYHVEPPDFSLELGGQGLIRHRLRHWFAEKGIRIKPSEFDAYFAAVSSFTQTSFSQRAELSLLKINLLAGKDRQKAIKRHAELFYWQFYDYYGPILTPEKVEEELLAYQSLTPKEIRQRIRKINQSIQAAKSDQAAILTKYPISQELKSAFYVLREFGYLYSDIKKEMSTKVNIALAEILHFVAEKNGIDPYLMHFATPNEIKDLLQGRVLDAKVLKQRQGRSVVACRLPEEYYSFLSHEEARKVRNQLFSYSEMATQQLKGMPACSGKFTGKVRIIKNVSQIDKIQAGEVLVAPMTTVNYVPAMKKAGAIVTDLGGITCHAAIVSRELGIPCIIGTKVATQILKNGDMVEVNADHGTVIKL